MQSHHSFLGLALALVIIWVVLRLALAITSGLLHLLWIGAVIFAIIWVVRQFSSGRSNP